MKIGAGERKTNRENDDELEWVFFSQAAHSSEKKVRKMYLRDTDLGSIQLCVGRSLPGT